MLTEVRKAIRENRTLAALASKQPEIGDQFEALMVEVVRTGGSAEQARARSREWGRTVVGPYFAQYAPLASDQALVGYAMALVDMLERVNR